MKKQFLALALIGNLFFVACDKVTPTTPTTPTTPSTTAPQPTFSGGDGALIAVKSITKTTVAGFPIETEIGTGVAVFGNLSAQTYTDAGTITLNSKSLSKQTNNSYTFIPSTTDPTGIDFSSGINWNVGGSSSVTAFNYNANSIGFPTGDEIVGSNTISSNSSFTVSTATTISNSDSVYFQMAGTGGVVLKRMAGNTSSVTFSASELQSVGKGSASIVVAPFRYTQQTINGKAIWVINETAFSKIVTIE
ncbi:MAG: hypothetical protein R2831_12870 [Chitinophagaceae bacterium]